MHWANKHFQSGYNDRPLSSDAGVSGSLLYRMGQDERTNAFRVPTTNWESSPSGGALDDYVQILVMIALGLFFYGSFFGWNSITSWLPLKGSDNLQTISSNSRGPTSQSVDYAIVTQNHNLQSCLRDRCTAVIPLRLGARVKLLHRAPNGFWLVQTMGPTGTIFTGFANGQFLTR